MAQSKGADARPAEAHRGDLTLVDSEGVRGRLAAQTLASADEHVLITFDEAEHVQVPRTLLQRREDGSYLLPVSLRALRAGDETAVAVIPLVAEEAHISTHAVETGRVQIRKSVRTVAEQIDLPLQRERVEIERVAVNRTLDEPAELRYEGDVLVIPVMEEVLVIDKRLILREEIRVIPVRDEVRHQETVSLQREEVSITRAPGDAAVRAESDSTDMPIQPQ